MAQATSDSVLEVIRQVFWITLKF